MLGEFVLEKATLPWTGPILGNCTMCAPTPKNISSVAQPTRMLTVLVSVMMAAGGRNVWIHQLTKENKPGRQPLPIAVLQISLYDKVSAASTVIARYRQLGKNAHNWPS